jgi:hypothetical protein
MPGIKDRIIRLIPSIRRIRRIPLIRRLAGWGGCDGRLG